MNISQEDLKKLLHYNPKTGILTWKVRPLSMFPNEGTCASWNSRCAGKDLTSVDSIGYISSSVNNKKYHAHRVAFFIYHGFLPEIVDHKNRIKTDNRISNLRAATKSLNSCNAKLRSNNTSGVKGVGWHKQSKRWRVRIKVNSVEHNFGLFIDKDEAIKVAKEKRKLLHGEFASG